MFVTVVVDLETELVPGLTKAQLREIARRTLESTREVTNVTTETYLAVDQVSSVAIGDMIEVGITYRDNLKAQRRMAAQPKDDAQAVAQA